MDENVHEADARDEGTATSDAGAKKGARHFKEGATPKRRVGLIVALLVICALVGGYALGYVYFRTHCAPGTKVFDVDVSGKDEAEVASTLRELVDTYSCHVTAEGLDLTITGKALALTCDEEQLAHDILTAQNRALWPVQALIGGHEVGSVLTFDEVALHSIIAAEVAEHNQDAREPISATLALDESGTSFFVVTEEPGTMLDADAVTRAMADAVRRIAPELPLGSEALVQPAHIAEAPETQAALERANGALAARFGLASSDGTIERTLSSETFAHWLKVADDLSLTLDAAAAAAWADATCGKAFDHADEAVVYCVDGDAFASALQDAIFLGRDATIRMPLAEVPRHIPAGGALVPIPWEASEGRYLIVDKATQTACLYDESGLVLWESTVTTGNEAAGDATPAGIYAIYEKRLDFTLLGNDVDGDGEPDYEHHVNWWMPFYGSIGLHDADWRENYGGQEYLERGSGGCVNLPADAAEALFKIIHVGDVVIIKE